MPMQQVITDLPDFKILDTRGSHFLKIDVVHEGIVKCIHCDSQRLRKKDTFWRKVRHICFGDRPSQLNLKAHKFKCLDCGKYFNQRFPGILPRKRSTEPFRKEVFQDHHDGKTQKTLAQRLRIGAATVERWYHDLLTLEHLKSSTGTKCPKVLGIDEHFFTRKKGYATTLCNLQKSRVHDVVLGRSERSLEGYLKGLPGRENTRVVVMDLSETYRSIVRKYFPNALIVADRFHVIRLINHQFMETWKLLDPVGRKNRGLISLMRQHQKNLKSHQKARLRRYLKEVNGLEPIYDFKQQLTELLSNKHKTARQCRPLIKEFLKIIEQLKNSGFAPLETLGKTLESWQEEIARMWRFTKTNSITEGLHNKMKRLIRNACGFRNFENYRGSPHSMVGC